METILDVLLKPEPARLQEAASAWSELASQDGCLVELERQIRVRFPKANLGRSADELHIVRDGRRLDIGVRKGELVVSENRRKYGGSLISYGGGSAGAIVSAIEEIAWFADASGNEEMGSD